MSAISFNRVKDGDYEVVMNGELIGHLCKCHDSGSGRALAKFVGAVKPFDYWQWSPEDGAWTVFDKFADAKTSIVKQYSGT